MKSALPVLLVAIAFAMAIAGVARGTRWRAFVLFAATSTAVAFVPLPAAWAEAAHLACWLTIVACGARVYVPIGLGSAGAFALAVASGVAGGAVVGEPMIAVLAALFASMASLAASAAARRLPVAPKVVSSWLIAVALLAATLQMLPVTPGYLPDHLE